LYLVATSSWGEKVAVCGGGGSGLTEALYMTKPASRVILLEEKPALTTSPILQERARHNEKVETGAPYVYAAGDVRSVSPGQVITGVGDGVTAAISIQKLLQPETYFS
jgi:thioredoxin reductase